MVNSPFSNLSKIFTHHNIDQFHAFFQTSRKFTIISLIVTAVIALVIYNLIPTLLELSIEQQFHQNAEKYWKEHQEIIFAGTIYYMLVLIIFYKKISLQHLIAATIALLICQAFNMALKFHAEPDTTIVITLLKGITAASLISAIYFTLAGQIDRKVPQTKYLAITTICAVALLIHEGTLSTSIITGAIYTTIAIFFTGKSLEIYKKQKVNSPECAPIIAACIYANLIIFSTF